MFRKVKSSRTYNVSGRCTLDIVSKSEKLLFCLHTEINKKNIALNQQLCIKLASGLSDTWMLDHYLIEKLI